MKQEIGKWQQTARKAEEAKKAEEARLAAEAARKAEEIRKKLQLPALYEQGGWVEYVMTTAGPEPRQYRQSPVDYDFYIDKQLAPIADSILVFKQSSMDKILDRQIGLF